jgi:hypothetical protein
MRTSTLAALAAGALLALGVPSANAAPPAPAPLSKVLSQSSVTEPVQFRRYCRRWHRECRARWGWGWRFRRCMARRGC